MCVLIKGLVALGILLVFTSIFLTLTSNIFDFAKKICDAGMHMKIFFLGVKILVVSILLIIIYLSYNNCLTFPDNVAILIV